MEQERTKFRLWFPLFILWPLLAVFVLLTLVATLLADLFSLIAGTSPATRAFCSACSGLRRRDPGHRSVRSRQDSQHTGPWLRSVERLR